MNCFFEVTRHLHEDKINPYDKERIANMFMDQIDKAKPEKKSMNKLRCIRYEA